MLCRLTVYGGILMIVAGLIGGFTVLFVEHARWSINLLMMVPYGFLFLLLGIAVCPLKDSEPHEPHEPK